MLQFSFVLAFFENLKDSKYKTFDDGKKLETLSVFDKWEKICRIRGVEPNVKDGCVVDEYKLFEHTLLHEMTHAVHKHYYRTIDTDPVGLASKKRQPTNDQKAETQFPLSGGGYKWGNIQWLKDKDHKGWNNADSYTYFGFGARLLKERGISILRNGCLKKAAKDYDFAAAIRTGPGVYVNAGGWEMPKSKRNIESFNERSPHLVQPSYPLHRRNITIGLPGSMGTSIVALSTSALNGISTTSSQTSAQTPSVPSDSSTAGFGPSTAANSFTSISGSASSLSVSTAVTSSNNLAASASMSSDIIASTLTSTITSSGGSIPQQNTSVNLPSSGIASTTTLNSVTSAIGLGELVSSFWGQKPTLTPVPDDEKSSDLFCTDEGLLNCILPIGFSLEKLVTATDVDIPTITDISIFPVIAVNGIDIVKMNLPTDKCNPIPKPSGGGFFGAILKVGSDIVNGIIDSACNIEIPVVKRGKIPEWLTFAKFPNPNSFPPATGGGPKEPQDPEDPEDPEEPTETPESSQASSSSSSSCSQTAFVSCDSSRLVSNSITQAGMACTTTSACSGADITKVTATTFVCSQTAIQDCQGTAIVSGSASSPTFFATRCSTRSACSGSGITSITTSVLSSTGIPQEVILEPELPEESFEQQQCVLSLVESATAAIEEADYSSCFGKTVDPTPSGILSLNPAYETITASMSDTPSSSISASLSGVVFSSMSDGSGATSTLSSASSSGVSSSTSENSSAAPTLSSASSSGVLSTSTSEGSSVAPTLSSVSSSGVVSTSTSEGSIATPTLSLISTPPAGVDSSTKTATPTVVPTQAPDFSDPNTNVNKCDDSGQMATREHMLEAAASFCKTYDGVTFGSNSFQAALVGFGWQEVQNSGYNILVRLEAKDNCRWTMNQDECNKQFIDLVDGCDQEGIIDKQGGVRENNCLIWRIDPEQSDDPEPSKPTPSPPPPAPKQPENKDGDITPRFDLLTSSFSTWNPVGTATWHFGQQAKSYYDEYDVCDSDYGWDDDGGVTSTKMPGEIKGITEVFGKTCDYDNNGADYEDANGGDQVGWLKCDGWDDAKCFKTTESFTCLGGLTMFWRITCAWGDA
ncbi:hypothetical protein BDW02DRAFT_411967 [Decorospora gaudefroyi]|uniref:Uncharacterized protein n=1 Tax=Decorospora gaudefroyi TaxID=184978 RepID=A0A6A5K4Z8_9PLEO|nr:hypothetical protein BDW02DRAFT_411967 [Decorospora gaudefroyi]